MKKLIALALAASAPGFAAAQDFNYTYIDVGFVDAEIDIGPVDLDGDGFEVVGSYVISDSVFLIGGYSDQDYDFGVDGHVLSLGGGFFTDLSENLDFVADLSYLDAEVATAGGSADENGYQIRAGVRGRIRPDLELEGGLSLVDIDDSDTGFRAVARYYFNEMFAVSGTLADIGDNMSLTIGVRAEFGGRR